MGQDRYTTLRSILVLVFLVLFFLGMHVHTWHTHGLCLQAPSFGPRSLHTRRLVIRKILVTWLLRRAEQRRRLQQRVLTTPSNTKALLYFLLYYLAWVCPLMRVGTAARGDRDRFLQLQQPTTECYQLSWLHEDTEDVSRKLLMLRTEKF